MLTITKKTPEDLSSDSDSEQQCTKAEKIAISALQSAKNTSEQTTLHKLESEKDTPQNTQLRTSPTLNEEAVRVPSQSIVNEVLQVLNEPPVQGRRMNGNLQFSDSEGFTLVCKVPENSVCDYFDEGEFNCWWEPIALTAGAGVRKPADKENKECNPRCSPNWMLGWKMTPSAKAKIAMHERIQCPGVANGCDSSCTRKVKLLMRPKDLTTIEVYVKGNHSAGFHPKKNPTENYKGRIAPKVRFQLLSEMRPRQHPSQSKIEHFKSGTGEKLTPKNATAMASVLLSGNQLKNLKNNSRRKRVFRKHHNNYTYVVKYIRKKMIDPDYKDCFLYSNPSAEATEGNPEEFMVVFSAPKLLELAVRAGKKIVGMDAVFKLTSPKAPFYVITVKHRNRVFPVCFCLSKRNTIESVTKFVEVFKEKIKQIAPKYNPYFMIDHCHIEIAAIMNNGFDFVLCQFHIVQLLDKLIAQHCPTATEEEKQKIKESFREIELGTTEAEVLSKVKKFLELFKAPKFAALVAAIKKSFFESPYLSAISSIRRECRDDLWNTNNFTEAFIRILRHVFTQSVRLSFVMFMTMMLEDLIPIVLVDLQHVDSGRVCGTNMKDYKKRIARANQIANHRGKIQLLLQDADLWIVESWNDGQPSSKSYMVMYDSTRWSCNCPVYENFQRHCKHILATQIVSKIEPTDPEPEFQNFSTTTKVEEITEPPLEISSWILGPENCGLLVKLLPKDFVLKDSESEEDENQKTEVTPFTSEIDFKPEKRRAKKKKAVDSEDESLPVGRDPIQKARKFRHQKKVKKEGTEKKATKTSSSKLYDWKELEDTSSQRYNRSKIPKTSTIKLAKSSMKFFGPDFASVLSQLNEVAPLAHGLTFQNENFWFFTFKTVLAASTVQAQFFLNNPGIDISGPEDYYYYCSEFNIIPPIPNKSPHAMKHSKAASKSERETDSEEEHEKIIFESEDDESMEQDLTLIPKVRKTVCNCITLGAPKYSCVKSQSSAKHCLCPCAEEANTNSERNCSPDCCCLCNVK